MIMHSWKLVMGNTFTYTWDNGLTIARWLRRIIRLRPVKQLQSCIIIQHKKGRYINMVFAHGGRVEIASRNPDQTLIPLFLYADGYIYKAFSPTPPTDLSGFWLYITIFGYTTHNSNTVLQGHWKWFIVTTYASDANLNSNRPSYAEIF